jgi:dTDP-4-dehydrorhamnose 3,5-epimerase-like enzyme
MVKLRSKSKEYHKSSGFFSSESRTQQAIWIHSGFRFRMKRKAPPLSRQRCIYVYVCTLLRRFSSIFVFIYNAARRSPLNWRYRRRPKVELWDFKHIKFSFLLPLVEFGWLFFLFKIIFSKRNLLWS